MSNQQIVLIDGKPKAMPTCYAGAARIRVEYLNRDGRPVSAEARGFFARVVQHECDHLDGIVFLDRMTDLTRLAFQREFDHYLAGSS